MSYPKKLLRLRPTQGIVADTPSVEVGPSFYTTGQNVIFRNGFASRIPGSRAAYDASAVNPILHLVNVRLGGANTWVAAGTATTYAIDTAGETDITISGGLAAVTDPWQWQSALLNGIPILTNGLDLPMYWDGNTSNDFLALPDFPATTSCKALATFRYHIFALDIDGPGGHFESQIKWSDAAEPGTVPATWTPAASNEAGDAELSDTPGAILCAHTLGGVLLIYKRSAVYQCDYVGGNQIFEFRKSLANIGALTPRSVVELNGQHLVVTDGDIILTDGVNVRSIGEARQKRFLFGNLDQENYLNLFVAYNRAKGEAWICFPEAGSQFCTMALVYDVAHDAFGVRDLDDVTCAALGIVDDETPSQFWDDDSGFWDDDSEVWNATGFSAALDSFVTATDNQITQHDSSDAVSVPSLVGKYDLTFDEPERIKFVRRLHVRTVSGSGTLLARVGARFTPADSITWGDEVQLDEPEQIVNVSIAGRYISVEVRAIASNVWTITAIDIEAEVRGYH